MRYRLSRIFIYTGFFALLLGGGHAVAAGAGVRVGTMGLGADVAFDIAPTVSARFGYSFASYNTDIEDTDVSYEADLKLSSFNAFIDWSPLPGPFRITAGLVPHNNRIEVSGRPTGGSYTLNGQTYTAGQIGSLDGEIEPDHAVAPYIGIGWGSVAGAGVNFYADLGVMYMGSPKASLNVTCGASLSAPDCQTLRNNVEAERRNLEHELRKARWYPVANIGVTIGF